MEQRKEHVSMVLQRLVPRVLDILTVHFRHSREAKGPVVSVPELDQLTADLGLDRPLPADPVSDDAFLDILQRYLAGSTRMQHPGYMAHQVAVPAAGTALADLVHGTTNNGMAIYEMGPAAVAVEMAVLDWMAGLAGWPRLRRPQDGEGDFCEGALTHGGSLANLTALLAARAAACPQGWEQGTEGMRLCVLAAPEAHYCISRSVGMMGLGLQALRPLPVDERQVIRPDGLPAALAEARQAGCHVMAVVASACSTGPGLYDPLHEVGTFCAEQNLWFHVDAAHGAAALLSPDLRRRVRGLEMADSFIWDAHKMLRTSSLCAAVLVRRDRGLSRAFSQQGSYLFDGEEHPGVDLLERTVECTKAALGLKVLFNILLCGVSGLRRHVERQYDLAQRCHAAIASRPGFSSPFPPQANIVCFRAPGDDDHQLQVRRRLLEDGQFHLSSTAIGGRRYLRLTLMGEDNRMEDIDRLLDAIEAFSPEPGGAPSS